LSQISADPARFLRDKTLALSRQRKELVTLALIRLATQDPEEAAEQLGKKWGVQLTAEERNWVWGVIGKRAALRLDLQAAQYFAQVSRDGDLSDDLLGWKVRAALRAGTQPQWPQVLSATAAMSENAARESTWVYWRAKALMETAAAAPAAASPAPAGAHAGPLSTAPRSTAGATPPQRWANARRARRHGRRTGSRSLRLRRTARSRSRSAAPRSGERSPTCRRSSARTGGAAPSTASDRAGGDLAAASGAAPSEARHVHPVDQHRPHRFGSLVVGLGAHGLDAAGHVLEVAGDGGTHCLPA
jgi:hypothetical protein